MDFWDGFAHDPRLPANAQMRASDSDREVVRAQLTEAYADGRLTQDEHEDRLGTTLRAKTLGELPPIVSDLVLPSRAPAPRAASDVRRQATREVLQNVLEVGGGSLTPFLICTVIWLFTSPGDYFWPMWVLIPFLLAVVPTLMSSPSRITQRARKLEDERRRELG